MNENKIEEIKNQDDSKLKDGRYHHYGTKIVLVVVGVLIVLGGAMAAARFTNRHARFENKVNIGKNAFLGRGMAGRGTIGRRFLNRGVSGDVTKIDGNTLTINNGTKDIAVNVQSTTSFSKNSQIAKLLDLIVGNNIVVSGASDSNGVVQATSIVIR